MKNFDFTKDLNKEQQEVVTAGDGPCLVLAGAGSGKTRTLVYRAAWLLSQGVPPAKILLLTFTNKAANQMMERVRELLGLQPKDKFALWGGTFHSVANRLLRIYGKQIGLEPNFTIMDTADVDAILKIIIKDLLGSLSAKHRPSPALLRETISFATNSKMSIEESLEYKFPEWIPLLEQFEKIAAEYQRRKQVSNALDFDGLLVYWRNLTEHPDLRKILANKWKYILVDEYQDTNTLQAEIIFNLAQQHQNILAVGDDAQSIYSFRAANIQNILEFPDKFPNCKTHKLEINYRSTPEILDLANQIIAGNKAQFVKNLKAVKENHVRPELIALGNNREEAWFIVDKIQQLFKKGVEPHNIAILFRAAHHSQNLEMELNKRGIAYEMRGGLKFFARAHIKDVLAFLKILGNYKDETAWLRILQFYPGIGPVTAQLIYKRIVELKNLEEVVDLKLNLADKASIGWSSISKLLEFLLKHRTENIGKLINLIIKDYGNYLMDKYTDYRQRQDDLEQLSLFASEYNNLEKFLNEISLQEDYSVRESEEQNRDSIILSTVHQAKGLEWTAVFIINMTDQAFPHPLCVREEEKEEERRLFYVAVTRACKYLYLTYPLSIFKYDGYKDLKPSPFLNEVDSKLLNNNGLARSASYDSEDGIEYVVDKDSYLPDTDW